MAKKNFNSFTYIFEYSYTYNTWICINQPDIPTLADLLSRLGLVVDDTCVFARFQKDVNTITYRVIGAMRITITIS